MAFSTWSALRTAIKDAIADHIAGTPCTGEYSIGDRRLKYRTFNELIGLLEKTYEIEAVESAGETSSMVSYGKPRNFR